MLSVGELYGTSIISVKHVCFPDCVILHEMTHKADVMVNNTLHSKLWFWNIGFYLTSLSNKKCEKSIPNFTYQERDHFKCQVIFIEAFQNQAI